MAGAHKHFDNEREIQIQCGDSNVQGTKITSTTWFPRLHWVSVARAFPAFFSISAAHNAAPTVDVKLNTIDASGTKFINVEMVPKLQKT